MCLFTNLSSSLSSVTASVVTSPAWSSMKVIFKIWGVYHIPGHLTTTHLLTQWVKVYRCHTEVLQTSNPAPFFHWKMIKYSALIMIYECMSVFLQRKYLVLKCISMQKKKSSVHVVETRIRKFKFLTSLKQKWNKLLGKSIFIPLCVWAGYFYETYLLAKHNLLVAEKEQLSNTLWSVYYRSHHGIILPVQKDWVLSDSKNPRIKIGHKHVQSMNK